MVKIEEMCGVVKKLQKELFLGCLFKITEQLENECVKKNPGSNKNLLEFSLI